MTIRFDCQFCGKTLKSDESKAGKKVKCPSCEGLLTIPGTPPESDDYEKEDWQIKASSAAYKQEQEDTDDDEDSGPVARVACPKCGEMKSRRAKVCPWCGDGKTTNKKKVREESDLRLADPGTRLLAYIIDYASTFVFLVPGGVMIGLGMPDQNADPGPIVFIGMLVLLFGLMANVVIQLYLLINQSQSIGKYMMNVQIYDRESNTPAGFVQTVLLRIIVNQLIIFFGNLLCVGIIYALVDMLFIFGEDHRCLHDHIAGTYVVDIS